MALQPKRWQVNLPSRPASVRSWDQSVLVIYPSGLLERRKVSDGSVQSQGVHPWAVSGGFPATAALAFAPVSATQAVLFHPGDANDNRVTYTLITDKAPALTYTPPAFITTNNNWEGYPTTDGLALKSTQWRVDAAGHPGGGMLLATGRRHIINDYAYYPQGAGALAAYFTVADNRVSFDRTTHGDSNVITQQSKFDSDYGFSAPQLFSPNYLIITPIAFGPGFTFRGSYPDVAANSRDDLWFDYMITGSSYPQLDRKIGSDYRVTIRYRDMGSGGESFAFFDLSVDANGPHGGIGNVQRQHLYINGVESLAAILCGNSEVAPTWFMAGGPDPNRTFAHRDWMALADSLAYAGGEVGSRQFRSLGHEFIEGQELPPPQGVTTSVLNTPGFGSVNHEIRARPQYAHAEGAAAPVDPEAYLGGNGPGNPDFPT